MPRNGALPAQMIAALEAEIGAGFVHAAELEAWTGDGTEARALPDLVVEPATTAEVAAVMTLAAQHGVPIIARGAGSGLAGGAVPLGGGIVISLVRLNRIIELDTAAMTITVEAGVITGDLQAAVEAVGLFYPPDPASLTWCTIGGNLACNAGGPRAVKYGVTRNYVLGITVVLADGRVVRLGGKTHKQATGYNLTQLFVGSEGTLGIITEATLRLLPLPPARATLTVLFPTLDAASTAVTAVLHSGSLPCTIELMGQVVLQAVERHLHLGLPADAGAMLVIEQDGLQLGALSDELAHIRAVCAAHGGFGAELATSALDRERLWIARRSVYHALLACAPNRRNEDIVVPRSQIPAMVQAVEAIAAAHQIEIAVFGHAGDGNLHPSILFDATTQLAVADQAEAAIMRAAIELGGMVSGEHGVGLLKRPYLAATVGPLALELMTMVKQTFDPHNLLNPGKIF